MENSKSYRESTREDINSRFKIWIDLAPKKKSLQNFILAHRSTLNLGERQIHNIEKSDVLAWFKVFSMRSPQQANRTIDDLKIVIDWAMENETWKVKKNFAILTKEELNPKHKRIDMLDPYTKEEFKRIRGVIMKKHTFRKNKKYPRNYAALMLILMGAFQGRRYRSEIGGVPWSKVDSDRIILDRTKTEDSRSMYELNRQTQWIIRQMKSYCKHKFKETRQIKYKTYVFPSIRKSKVGHCFNIDKTFKTVCAEAKVRRLPVYMLRHTWGSNAVAAGVPLDDIKDSGGWKSWAMVETYAKRDRKRRKKTSQKIATFMATGK
jgi:integrase